jgi:hypothetical protein
VEEEEEEEEEELEVVVVVVVVVVVMISWRHTYGQHLAPLPPTRAVLALHNPTVLRRQTKRPPSQQAS